MSSHLLYLHQKNEIITQFKFDDLSHDGYELHPFLPLKIAITTKKKGDSKAIIITINDLNDSFFMLNKLGMLGSSYEIVVLNRETDSYFISEKITYLPQENRARYSIKFSIDLQKTKIFSLYLLYLPKLTSEINFSAIRYETPRCKTEFKIKLMKFGQKRTKVIFETDEEPPVTHIYAVKISDKDEKHEIQVSKNSEFQIDIKKKYSDLPIYCGVFEILFPDETSIPFFDINTFSSTDLTDTNPNLYQNIPSMNLYQVRYGYDILSSSIVFEIFLKNLARKAISNNFDDDKNNNFDDDKNNNLDDDKNNNLDDDKNNNFDDKNNNLDDDKNNNFDDDKNNNFDDDKNNNFDDDKNNNLDDDGFKDIKYDYIGVEIRTKFGKCFKFGYGHISNDHPIHVRFSPKDLNQLGDFRKDNVLSICFCNDRFFKTEILTNSFGFKINIELLELLRKFLKLYLYNPSLFRDDVQYFFKKLAFEPQSVNILEFYKIILSKLCSNLVTTELINNINGVNVLKEITAKLIKNGKFLIENDASHRIRNKSFRRYFGFVKKVISLSQNPNCIFSYKEEKNDFTYDTSLPFYEYYHKRNNEFFYPPKPFLPIHPFLIHPQFTPDFNYQHYPKTSIFLIENDIATVDDGLITVNIEDFLKEEKYKNVILAPVIISYYEAIEQYVYNENEIETGRTYICIDNDDDNDHYYYIIYFEIKNGFLGAVQIQKSTHEKIINEKNLVLKVSSQKGEIQIHFSFVMKREKTQKSINNNEKKEIKEEEEEEAYNDDEVKSQAQKSKDKYKMIDKKQALENKEQTNEEIRENNNKEEEQEEANEEEEEEEEAYYDDDEKSQAQKSTDKYKIMDKKRTLENKEQANEEIKENDNKEEEQEEIKEEENEEKIEEEEENEEEERSKAQKNPDKKINKKQTLKNEKEETNEEEEVIEEDDEVFEEDDDEVVEEEEEEAVEEEEEEAIEEEEEEEEAIEEEEEEAIEEEEEEAIEEEEEEAIEEEEEEAIEEEEEEAIEEEEEEAVEKKKKREVKSKKHK